MWTICRYDGFIMAHQTSHARIYQDDGHIEYAMLCGETYYGEDMSLPCEDVDEEKCDECYRLAILEELGE